MRSFFTLFMLFGSVFLVISSTVNGGKQRISFPENYRETYTNYLSLDRVQHPDQVIRLFANDLAMQGPGDDGKLPFGSILVAEIFDAKLDSHDEVITSSLGRRIIDRLALIGVMQREKGWGAQFPQTIRNGNWEYAAFNDDGSMASADINSCMACHVPLEKTNYLFSYEHLKKIDSTKCCGPGFFEKILVGNSSQFCGKLFLWHGSSLRSELF